MAKISVSIALFATQPNVYFPDDSVPNSKEVDLGIGVPLVAKVPLPDILHEKDVAFIVPST